WIGPWLSKITGVPYVLTVNQFLSAGQQIPVGSMCMGIVAVSQALREFLINHLNLPNKLIKVIPNGVDIFRFCLPKYKPPNLPKIILNIGRFEPIYGMETLIEACVKLREKKQKFTLLLMGDGSGEHELRELCRQKNLTHDTLFSPPRMDYERFFQLADIYVSPSQSEGMGQTILEAMSCGLPIVATRVGGIFTAVQDHQTGILVPKNDPQLMAEGILEIIQNSDLADKLTKNARNLIQTNFNLAQMVDAFEEFYEEKFRYQMT
ncbi:MAG: glycosyltransferase family 4 protein, partial [Planctomycetota bacterium]